MPICSSVRCCHTAARAWRSLLGVAALLVSCAVPATAQGAPGELGIWHTHTGKGAVQIYRCMQDPSRLCGRIVWLKTKTYDNGEPLKDRRNPRAKLRSRQICGLPMLGNLQKSGRTWKNGWVYDPEKGTTHTASIVANGPDTLTLTGYKGIFYKTFKWTRAPADLPRCGDLEPVAQ